MIEPKSTRRSLPMALLRARESVMENFRPMLARLQVTEQQWRVIRVVAEAGQIDATEAAARAAILAPSLTRMIRTLVTLKFIKRLRDKEDGRKVILEITPAGQKLVQNALPESMKIYQHIETQFGEKNLNQLLDLLDTLSNTQKP
jgi:homoprotocatechuate degradation regulator HpaR